jgi:hypothetical protein
MSHKFELRQLVRIARPDFGDTQSKAVYEVTRLMPADQSGQVSYRIRSSEAGEKAVREDQITAAAKQLGHSAFS